MRRVVPILSLSAAALLLAGCTASPTAQPGADGECVAIASGSASEGVAVEGEAGAEPTVVIDPPVSVDETQRTLVIEGDGELVEPGSLALVDFSIYNAVSGELATSTGHGTGQSAQLPVDEAQALVGFVKSVECAHVGDRIVSVLAAADAYGEAGYPDFGIAAGESVIFVVDVVGVAPTRADGEEQELSDEFPLVEFDADGRPTVTIPEEEPPAKLTVGLTRKGDGMVVAAGDSVTVQYQGVNWTTGEVFDESWGNAPATFTTTGVIKGFGDALVGQAVGSQVVVIIPPDLGYGPQGGNSGAGIAEDDTLVFVVDILGTTPG